MMMQQDWSEKNQKYLVSKIVEVKMYLKKYVAKLEGKSIREKDIKSPEWDGDQLPAIDNMARLFGLSSFEKLVLLLCAGVELDTEISKLCMNAQGSTRYLHPTFGLAMAIFPKPHWSAITPISPLRLFQLVDMLSTENTTITSSPLKIEERILHYMTGVSYLDGQLHGMVRPLVVDALLVNSQKKLIDKIILSCNSDKVRPVHVHLYGTDESSKQIIAKNVCDKLNLNLWHIQADLIPSKTDELETFVRLWRRESVLLAAGIYISAEDAETPTVKVISRLLDSHITTPIFVGTRERLSSFKDDVLSLEVQKPERVEQIQLWKEYLGKCTENGNLDSDLSKIAGQFDLNAESIQKASSEALSLIGGHKKFHGSVLWQSCRNISRPKMNGLAQRIVSKATMNNLVLPSKEKQLLCDIVIQMKNKDKVYREWGFENEISRGLGIIALFSGESGTGKTMAAEVLATELNLDLFRIDLSMVVSKYIGETEKNLRQVFDAAEDGGAILFFDEADALFGKRSEIHDSHDRYANIEVGYLLQRLESYTGLAILATNNKSSMDSAFLRRIRFIIHFPFPDEASREKIWQYVFPESVPVDGIEFKRLAKLNIAGGHIRNIALNASFIAAEKNSPVRMDHVKQAIQKEYDKLERPLTRIELGSD